MELLVQLLICAAFGGVCALIASSKGRSAIGWFCIGFLAPCIGLILVLVLPDLKAEHERRRRLLGENRRLRERLKKDRQVADRRHEEHSRRLEVHDRALGVDTAPRLESGEPAEQLAAGAVPPIPGAGPSDPGEFDWHYVKEGRAVGPVSVAAMKALWRAGRVAPDTLVWNETMNEWKALEAVPELREALGG